MLHHLRKRPLLRLGEPKIMDEFRGSTHIIAQARSVIGIARV